MNVSIISTHPNKCGIGMTNHYLMRGMAEFLNSYNLEVKDIFFREITKPESLNPLRFLNLVKQSKGSDLLHIQYNHDCFGTLNKKINGFQNVFVYTYAKLMGMKIITTFHEASDLSEATSIKKILYRIVNFCPLHLSDHVIVMNNTVKNLIISQDKIKASKISVIPLGSFTNVPKKVDKIMAKKKLKLNTRNKVVTVFGYVDSNKGHDKIISALPELGNVHFLIAGGVRSKKGSRYKGKLKDMIKEKGLKDRVTFSGYVEEEDYPLILGATDILVFPYTQISNSLALTTAISYNIPILTSDIPSLKEFHYNTGATRIFHVNDRKDLIREINKILNSKKIAAKLIEKQKRFISLFNWKEIARRTLDVYKRII